MDMVTQRDLASTLLGAPASAFTAITAGGSGDNTAIVGLPIDRFSFGVALTVAFQVVSQAVLAAAATLTLKNALLEHSADGATWSTFRSFADPGVVATGPNGGGTVRAVTQLGTGLREAQRYVRLSFTPDLSAANTDTGQVVALAVLGGFDRLPPVLGSAV